eukprot:5673079-Amphidinium_carterae.3
MLLGAYCSRGCGITRRTFTPFGRAILQLVHELALHRPGASAGEPYLSINVNQNQHLSAHQDKQNWESSWLLGVGVYEQGELWISDGKKQCTSSLPVSLQGDMPQGVLGRLVNVRHRWFKFSGRSWHAVLEAKGYRASVTLFTPRAHQLLSPGHWRQLAQLGFPIFTILSQMLSREPSLDGRKLHALKELRAKLDMASPVAASNPKPATSETKKPEFGFDSVMEILCALRLHLPSDLQTFMHAIASRHSSGVQHPVGQVSSSSQWGLPLPLPFGEVCGSPHSSVAPESGRRRSRFFRERNFREFANFVVASMNWLHFGRPHHGLCAEFVPLQCSVAQERLMLPLLDGLKTWYRSRRISSDSDGAPLLDGGLSRLIASLVCVAGHYGKAVAPDQSVGSSLGSMETVSLSASTMSLPTQAGKVALDWPLIPTEVRELLETEDAFLSSEAPSCLPKTFTLVDDWLAVLHSLLDCGLCELVPDPLAPRHMGTRVSAGLFGVPKKGSEQTRLIVDR